MVERKLRHHMVNVDHVRIFWLLRTLINNLDYHAPQTDFDLWLALVGNAEKLCSALKASPLSVRLEVRSEGSSDDLTLVYDGRCAKICYQDGAVVGREEIVAFLDDLRYT